MQIKNCLFFILLLALSNTFVMPCAYRAALLQRPENPSNSEALHYPKQIIPVYHKGRSNLFNDDKKSRDTFINQESDLKSQFSWGDVFTDASSFAKGQEIAFRDTAAIPTYLQLSNVFGVEIDDDDNETDDKALDTVQKIKKAQFKQLNTLCQLTHRDGESIETNLKYPNDLPLEKVNFIDPLLLQQLSSYPPTLALSLAYWVLKVALVANGLPPLIETEDEQKKILRASRRRRK